MDKESAILQGGFLLADKLCLPLSLASVQKCDWARVGQPILAAVKDLCGQVEHSSPANVLHWKAKVVCVLWCKQLCRELREDVETGWRENPLFPLQNGLPEVSRVVLLELVKSMEAADIFGQFLLCLPDAQVCSELTGLAKHVTCGPTSEEDVRLLLDVWWELWRGRVEDRVDISLGQMFAQQFARLSCPQPLSAVAATQAAKRFKLDTASVPPSSSQSSQSSDVLYILLHTLRDVRNNIFTADLCCQALSVALDAIYTSFLIDQAVVLPTEQKLRILSKAASLKEEDDGKWSSVLLQEAQRDLRVSHSPSTFRPNVVTLPQALGLVTELMQCCQQRGLPKANDGSDPSYFVFRLSQSAQRTLEALERVSELETMSGMEGEQVLGEAMNGLRQVLELLAFLDPESSQEAKARVTMSIIDHRLEDYGDFAKVFAAEKSWAARDSRWTDCLERNQAAFQQHDTVVTLADALIYKCGREGADVSQCRKLSKTIANIFLELSLEDKNKALDAMLKLSSRGFYGSCAPPVLIEGFGQELNMAFNCIIQGGGRAATAGSHGNLDTATSLVARVAFQNPEATLRRCCHTAVFNKGAFSLMAKILQRLPGLMGGIGREDTTAVGDGSRDASGDASLLCSCLQETVLTKELMSNEVAQFLSFLALLMEPVKVVDGEEMRSLLSPREVVSFFVLPHYCVTDRGPISMELSVQILHSALTVELQEPASSRHWVMDCSPFPLLCVLAQHLNRASRCWEEPAEDALPHFSMDTKELLVLVLTTLGQLVGREVASAPGTWSRALFWLYSKVEELDWTVRFYLKPVWGEHFKNEVPSSLLAVCNLPEQEWSGLDLSQYGQGSGLLPWVECCCVSDSLRSTMLSSLSLDCRRPDHINMFSKGLLVALAQTLPWCSVAEWGRLLGALRELLDSGRLHAPYSLEYVDYLPLLDLRGFSVELRLSVILLRALQLLCGASCSGWLTAGGCVHVGMLYAHAVRAMLESLRAKLPLSSSGSSAISQSAATSSPSPRSPKSRKSQPGNLKQEVEAASGPQADIARSESPESPNTSAAASLEGAGTVPSQEVLFVLSQLFCHVQHVQVMMPGGQCEAMFLCALEILSLYEAIMVSFPDSSTFLESSNTRHFFSTITENLESKEMKAVLQQKISQLTSAVA